MAKDFYKSLDELKAHKKEGVDYKEIIKNRCSKITILSIHGGFIEFGTSELAKKIAKDDFNYYDFSALGKEERGEFHITSTKFYQKDLEMILKKSDTAVSVHGCDPRSLDKPAVYVGGLNKKLKKLIRDELKKAGFKASTKYFPGRYKKNVVNRTKSGGVQLELEFTLRETLFEDVTQGNRKPSKRFYLFTEAVRSAIAEYLKEDVG